jgi:hypothetical protein
MLGAGTTAIAGCGEKTIMAAGRCVWMIVTILGDRIGLGIVVVVLGPRGGVIVAMIGRHLGVLVVRAVLRTHGSWGHSGQCERKHTENKRV